jgi:hypothetical protein
MLINFIAEGDQVWEEQEVATVEQAALDIGAAIARDISQVFDRFQRLHAMFVAPGDVRAPMAAIDPAEAFLQVYGRPIRFVRKAVNASGTFWGETFPPDRVEVYRNAPHTVLADAPASVGNRPQFAVHELGHAFENVCFAAFHAKKGRESIPTNLLNRPKGFFQIRRFQQSPQNNGRGEIFADMFIGWVYDRWETLDGLPDSPLRETGMARKRFMADIMIDLLEAIINHNRNP